MPSFTQIALENRQLWWSHNGNHAFRNGNWKVVQSRQGGWELYDLENDRTETKNLADEQPEKVRELVADWEARVEGFRKVRKVP